MWVKPVNVASLEKKPLIKTDFGEEKRCKKKIVYDKLG